MAKQNKGRKFFATTATAALVASAIVPVASAAYGDEAKISTWAKDAVDYVTEAGYMQGDNGNFDPQGTFTRAQAATIAVNVLGLDTTGTEYETSFSDVKKGQWFFEEVGAAADAGILNGTGDGKFNPNGKLSRQDAAIILAGIYGLDVDAADVSVLDQFSDKGSIAGYATKYVAALVEAGVIQGSNGKFNPTGDITREQLAVMLAKADVELTITLEQALADLETAVKELPAVADVKKETIETAKEKVAAANEAIENAEYVLDALKEELTEGEVKAAEKAIADAKASVAAVQTAIDKIIAAGVELEVVDVKSVNAKEIVIEFNTALDKISAETAANYVLEVGSAAAPFTVEFDENSPKQVKLVATSAIANDAVIKLTVKKGLLTEALNDLDADFTKVYVAGDKVAPTITTVEKVGADVVVTFSEDIASIGLVKFNNTTYATGSYTVSGKKLTITGAATGLAVGNYDLVLNAVADSVPAPNTNTTGLITGTLTITADTVVPAVTKVTQAGDNQVKVTFSKPVDPVVGATPVVVTKNGYPLTVSAGTPNTAKTEYTYTLSDNGSVKVYDTNTETSAIVVTVNGFKDANGTIANAFTQSLTLSKDKTAPAVVARFNKITDNGTAPAVDEVFDIYFDEVITTTALGTPSNVVLTDKNGIRQAATGVSVVADANGDNKILRIESTTVQTTGAINVGEYTISLPAGFVQDSSVNLNKNAATTVKFTKSGSASTGVTASASAAANVITVAYGSPMNNAAALVANYQLDGKALPAGTVAYFNADNQTVKIELPAASVAVSGGGVLTISDNVVSTTGVKVAAANKFISIATGLLDNIKPVLASAKKLSITEVELTFSEAVDPATIAAANDDFTVTINGVTVAPTAIAAGTAANKVKLTLPTYNTAQEVKVTVNAPSTSPALTIDLADIAGNKITSGTVVTAQ